MSTIEAIERRQEYEQMKRKKDAERKAKEETKRRLAELAEERRQKTEYANKALLGTLEQSSTTATTTSTSTSTQVKTPPSTSTTTSIGDCILQIRMVGGATIKHTFKATDTMQVVYDYVQSVRTDTATSSVPFSLTAFPKKEYKAGNLDVTLTAAGLAPRGQLVMNLSGVEQKQATSSGDVSSMYFQSLLHQVSATSVTSGRTIDLSTKPIIVIAFVTRQDGGYVEKQFNRIKKMYPAIYFGTCDMDEKSELATKQGVTSSGVFHIYKGMERVEEVTRDIHALESALRKHAPITTPTEPSSTYDRITSAAIVLPRHTPTSFKVQLEGSPAKGMFWDVISMDPHIARVGTWTYIPKNASLEDDADGIDGLFSFTFLYHPTPTPSTSTSTSTSTSPRSIVFHYTKPWRHDAPPLDQHTLTFTYANDMEDQDEDEDEYDHQHEDDEDEEM